MAGGYNHIVTEDGNLRSNKAFVNMIENLGDAYEMAEELYGMVWFLAHMAPDSNAMSSADLVEMARKNYAIGLELAKQNKDKGKRRE